MQKRPPAPSASNGLRAIHDQSPSETPPAPAAIGTRHDAQHQNQTYAIDIVQTLRVTSDEPLTRREIDAVKKSLGKLGLEAGDRGCVSDDEGGAKLRVVQTALQVVRGSGAGRSSTPPPLPPPRPHSANAASPRVPAKQDLDHSKQVSQPPKRILFYHAHDPYYGFTNFSPDAVKYKGKRYPTSEHLFQSLKFLDHRPELAEHIRTCSPRPRIVFDETHRFNPEVRQDWLHVRVDMMDMVLWLKFTQNEHLKRELLSTGDAELVEDSDKDAFWGIGPDGKGENQLGKALQRLRARLRDDVSVRPSQQR